MYVWGIPGFPWGEFCEIRQAVVGGSDLGSPGGSFGGSPVGSIGWVVSRLFLVLLFVPSRKPKILSVGAKYQTPPVASKVNSDCKNSQFQVFWMLPWGGKQQLNFNLRSKL